MRPRARLWFFAVAATALVGALAAALNRLPLVGENASAYARVTSALTVSTRHATDVVTAITFDFRGFDTLGEELILFAAVLGVSLLLRREPRERETAPEETSPERSVPEASEAVRFYTLAQTLPLALFGVYLVSHGHLSPGGGFQGGVVLATAPVLVYVAGGYRAFCRIAPRRAAIVTEALGLAGYVSLGLLPLATGAQFLENVWPLGETHQLFSSGSIMALNIGTGVAVTSGLVLAAHDFLEESLVLRSRVKTR